MSVIAVLGLVMAARWIGVYRKVAAPGPSLTILVLVLFTALGVRLG
jgi:hypothetical protein